MAQLTSVLGKYLDRTYRQSVAKLSAGQETLNGDSAEFPIETIRLKGAYVLIIASALGSVGYGLALMTKAVSRVGSRGLLVAESIL